MRLDLRPPSTGSADLFFQPLPLLVLVGVDWPHRRVEKSMLDPSQSIHFTSTLTYGKVKGTLPSCFSLPSRTRIVVFNFVIFTDGPQRFLEFQCGLEWKPPLWFRSGRRDRQADRPVPPARNATLNRRRRRRWRCPFFFFLGTDGRRREECRAAAVQRTPFPPSINAAAAAERERPFSSTRSLARPLARSEEPRRLLLERARIRFSLARSLLFPPSAAAVA